LAGAKTRRFGSSCLRVTVNTDRAAATKAKEPVIRASARSLSLGEMRDADDSNSIFRSQRFEATKQCPYVRDAVRVEAMKIAWAQARIDRVDDYESRLPKSAQYFFELPQISYEVKRSRARVIIHSLDEVDPLKPGASGLKPRDKGSADNSH
jgi:hypothetical protein